MTSCASGKIRSYGTRELAGMGFCLPVPVAEIEISNAVDLSSVLISDVEFRGYDELVLIDVNGMLSVLNINSENDRLLANFGMGNWKILPIDSGRMAVYEFTGEGIEIITLKSNGQELWRRGFEPKATDPFFYNGNIFMPLASQDGRLKLHLLDSDGETVQVVEVDVSTDCEVYPIADGVIATCAESGPYFVTDYGSSEYRVEAWNDRYCGGATSTIIASAGRLVGYDGTGTKAFFLDRIQAPDMEDIISFWSGMDLDAIADPDNRAVASNGDVVAISYPDCILKIQGGNVSVWSQGSETLRLPDRGEKIYINEDCSEFIAHSKSRLVIGSSSYVRELIFEGLTSTDIVFSPDFSHAAVGTTDGGVYIFTTQPQT